ncbi:HNH endonuclease, partial [bacterium]|nr:HNH endonuclease [bacterium]
RLIANRVNSNFMSSLLSESTKKREQVKETFEAITEKKIQKRCESLFNAYTYCYRYLRDAAVKEIKDIVVDEDSDAKIDEFLTTSEEMEKAANYLNQFRLHFLQNSLIVKIQISNWMESFELFDGLNNRGMELAAKDVLKNVILSRAAGSGDSMVDKVEDQWKKFDEFTSVFDFNKFLRHWLLLEHEEVSLGGATRLFVFRTQHEKPMETVERLNDAALFYSAIDSPNPGLTSDKNELRFYENLKTMSAQRVRPIMLAALLSNVKQKELCEILKSLETLHFRRSAICQLDNKTLEVSVQRIASELFKEGTSGAKKAISEIKKLNPSDEIFALNFQNKSGMPHGIARYMLLKIENHLRIGKGMPEIDSEDVTLEHIMPQEPNDHWKLDPNKPEVKVLIGRLGNLTLLRGKVNSSARNFDFTSKKALYGGAEHSLFITSDVIHQTEWTVKQIAERQDALSKLALQVWKI